MALGATQTGTGTDPAPRLRRLVEVVGSRVGHCQQRRRTDDRCRLDVTRACPHSSRAIRPAGRVRATTARSGYARGIMSAKRRCFIKRSRLRRLRRARTIRTGRTGSDAYSDCRATSSLATLRLIRYLLFV